MRLIRNNIGIKSLFFFPFVISQVVIGLIFTWFYQPNYGVIAPFLDLIGLEGFSILANENTATYGIIFAGLYPQIAYCLILYLTGLNNILTLNKLRLGEWMAPKDFIYFGI